MFLENHDYAMENGEIFPREKVSELVQEILNKFAEEELSVHEAKLILQRTIDVVGQFSSKNQELSNDCRRKNYGKAGT